MDIKAISTHQAPAAIGPYSQAIAAGDFVYLSGQLGVDPATGVMEKDVCAQAQRALENMKAILREAGLDISRVVKTTVFLKDMNDFAAVNEIYSTHFVQPYPARSCVQVAQLPKGALVINVGRGTAVDQDALIEALNSEAIGGAALDVVMPEPLPADHPLRAAKNILLTPHVAGNLTLGYTCQRNVELFLEDLDNYAAGLPLKRFFDRKKGY